MNTIRQGDKGPDVATWQRVIGVEPDGIFGPQTAAATRAWQSAHGITADGIVGPQTWATVPAAAIASSAPMSFKSPVVIASIVLLVAIAWGLAKGK